MGEHSIQHTEIKTYSVTKNNKLLAFILMGIGLASIAYGFATDGLREWANLLLGNFYLMAIALGSLFFLAIQYVSEVGWTVQLKRIMLANSMYLIPATLFMIIIFIFGHHDLYHWTHHDLIDKTSPHYDKIIDGKSSFLNVPFFIIRLVLYAVIWAGAAILLRREAIKEDMNGGNTHYFKSFKISAIFLVLFAVSSSTSAWDIIMSLDPHWFSTLFGWYVFSGTFVSALTVITLITIYLKKAGYLPNVNASHLHDLGKFMFAFSIFWTYLWFSQFMLYWYANIPEEVTYFIDRVNNYRILFWLSPIINFVIPFLVLMTRESKRYNSLIIISSIFMLFGHWLDLYLMIMPGTVGHEHSHLGIPEFGTLAFFVGLFLYVMFTSLSKAPIIPKNHPMLQESFHHHI
ncbi:MAG: quinol:cytochrome C oxidoreductase [Chitinophagaceae bacterium]|nr:quinol:cytochrome C oxidoreductase [Chitinophagaceae bacterium]